MKKIIISALLALLLASCSDGTVPALPKESATLPPVTTAAPETEVASTAAPVEPAEPVVIESAEDLVAYFNETFQTAKQTYKEAMPVSTLPALTKAMTEKAIDALTYTFGETVAISENAATAAVTVTYLDQAAFFDDYMAALTDEDGNIADDENGEVFLEMLGTTDKIVTEEGSLFIIKDKNGWELGEGSINLIEFLPERLISIPVM